MKVTDEERKSAQMVMRMIQIQIKYPGELVERAIRTIVRDELEKMNEEEAA